MPTDRYTKFILTIIAIGLFLVAGGGIFSPGVAVHAQTSGCGEEPNHPCYVAGWGPGGTVPIANTGRTPLKVILLGNAAPNPIPVIVVNPPRPLGGR